MNNKGQTTIEYITILSISLVALAIIFSLYSDQLVLAQDTQETIIAKNSVQNIVNAANLAYLSGKGSEIRVEMEMPAIVDLSRSSINGGHISLVLENGSEVFAIADVNIDGEFRDIVGKSVVYLNYDGSVVNMHYNDFELNTQNIFASVFDDSVYNSTFIVRNNSSGNIDFNLLPNFSHTKVAFNISDDEFSLGAGELKTIDFNFIIDQNALGNYTGLIDINANYLGNISKKQIVISVEVLP